MKSIVVFRAAALGDFILATPAFKTLRESFPNRNLILLTLATTEKKTLKLVGQYSGGSSSLPWVELVVPHLFDEVIIMESISSPMYLKKIRDYLKGLNVEAAVLMLDPCAPWMGRIKKIFLLRLLVGFVKIYGWRGRGSIKGDLKKIKKKGWLHHHVHGPLQYLSELNPPISYNEKDLIFDLRPSFNDQQWAKSFILELEPAGATLIALMPGSIQPHKIWPTSNYIKLSTLLLERYNDIQILILGTQKDASLGGSIQRVNQKRITNLAGVTSIGQSAALLENIFLTIGNDGGGVHLADAMGGKVISIVPGIEFPDSIEPWHNKIHAIRSDKCTKAPCYSFTSCPLEHQVCMTTIEVEDVFKSCVKILEHRS